ncbi:protein-L-isoaspartate(D-aspartate) O-methyltransferase [Lentibacillus sediminis]|uniref:protein-L-isoaspartate(D-aspartate) O-methyltransferase n=1 Tax=Lentibacillus sediminis TaxID=1940529 RepID=UPI000C1B885F|nr:protein-L-isoaspartate(D-aspartate) O-methyltransferase [Lentibacillus sediminis]
MDKRREEIEAYFRQLDRSYFMESSTGNAAADRPVSIGFGQTISQPTLVLEMTIQLDLQPDSRVLEIGTGSGYQTALLAPFCREVYTVERLEALYHNAKARLDATGFTNIHFKHGDGSLGWPEHQPYDRIIVTASVSRVPNELLDQLDAGGKMIIPVGDSFLQELQMIEKDDNGEVTTSVLEGVAFVRLKGEYE